MRCINCNGLKVQSNYQSHLQVELQVNAQKKNSDEKEHINETIKGIHLEQLMNTAEDEILTADNLVFCNRYNIIIFNSTRSTTQNTIQLPR